MTITLNRRWQDVCDLLWRLGLMNDQAPTALITGGVMSLPIYAARAWSGR